MSMGLTARQLELLNFLRSHFAAHGVMPTVEEIRVGMGVHSTACIQDRLDGLEERGAIVFVRHHRTGVRLPRKIELVQPQYNDLSDCNCEGCARAVAKLAARSGQSLAQNLPAEVA